MHFKNILGVFALAGVALLTGSCGKGSADETANASDTGWVSLFDGKTLNGWTQYGHDSIVSLWSVDNGTILCSSSGGGESKDTGGSLMTKDTYGNFELELEFKIDSMGNSGILYHVVYDTAYKHAYESGPEYQIVDDSYYIHDPADKHQTAADYDMYAPGANKKLNPTGQWNSARLIYNNGHVEQWLNGEKVVEFEEGSPDWKQRYDSSKWVNYPGYAKFKTGAIALQDHGNHAWFRNIRIKRL